MFNFDITIVLIGTTNTVIPRFTVQFGGKENGGVYREAVNHGKIFIDLHTELVFRGKENGTVNPEKR